MYFKRLEIVGFKSFMEKTTLDFEPGITAVVGPNGCGKSNIFDSIRWVLGEQSAKSLRGSDMQDVIFNGTDLKEPLGMAEVTVAFDNTQKAFPVDNDEVAITRRIFRSGESEYLLNKNTVRLKDILDLLAGTGIGAESYSMVAQGKIDLILSSRPEDRRVVFDEASGITKYKSQKREALRKLEETEANLARVNDIITEVRRQIGSLERQANKARKYKEVFEELKIKETNLASLQKAQLLKEKEGILRELERLQIQEAELLSSIKEQESRISNRQSEIKALEDGIMAIKNNILGLDNQIIRDKERANFDKEKIAELEAAKTYLNTQIEQLKNKLSFDEEKLNKARFEHDNLAKDIQDRTTILTDKETKLHEINIALKASSENIIRAKKNILELTIETTKVNNDISDFLSKQQIFFARKKRLELEKAKLHEEHALTESGLNEIIEELEKLNMAFEESSRKVAESKGELEQETVALDKVNFSLEDLEKQKVALESHKEFIEKLKTKYEDISESMNATIILDKAPNQQFTGLVVKIRPGQDSADRFLGEAKPIDLDTAKIIERINQVKVEAEGLKNNKVDIGNRILKLKTDLSALEHDLKTQEINLANKKALHQNVLEQFNKIKDEEQIIDLELNDVQVQVIELDEKLNSLKSCLAGLDLERKKAEDSINSEQSNIVTNTALKETALVEITQLKTELEALNRRIESDIATLNMLSDAYNQDNDALANTQKQLSDSSGRIEMLGIEVVELEKKVIDAIEKIKQEDLALKDAESNYVKTSDGISDVVRRIEMDRRALDILKEKLYELQMQNKDVDFKFQSIKDRILQAYRIEFESLDISVIDPAADIDLLNQEIQSLKEKIDSYGTVNLVAIEEYDELKKRYDFLVQQEADLTSAKDSLREAISKINRTTKQMFLETFDKVREEFRNYFRLLFNGGDAQIFLIDEQDPLESGIEIICRPPGKKLQNVLLLSGGEKAMSAIALIFAIFKVKPSPFCILDEIDAPLDEANVDRFGRMLKDFTKISQFIVITHNKKTIANADVMYGITMEESGVSKIVSVKFAQNKQNQAPQVAPQAQAEESNTAVA